MKKKEAPQLAAPVGGGSDSSDEASGAGEDGGSRSDNDLFENSFVNENVVANDANDDHSHADSPSQGQADMCDGRSTEGEEPMEHSPHDPKELAKSIAIGDVKSPDLGQIGSETDAASILMDAQGLVDPPIFKLSESETEIRRQWQPHVWDFYGEILAGRGVQIYPLKFATTNTGMNTEPRNFKDQTVDSLYLV